MHFMMVGFCGSFFPCLLHIGVFIAAFNLKYLQLVFPQKWLAKFVCDTEEADCGKVIENYQAFTFVMKLRS